MNKAYFIVVIFISTLFLLSPRAVMSQQEERLAVVSEYEGDVKVEHESIKKTVTRIGNRIRNSAVYEEDSVMTMHDSTADLVFNDNTSLEIDEDTSLTISSREMSGEEKAEGGFIRQVSGGQSGIVRNIHVKAGKFLANITPSKSVLTEFETPTGTASVRGTAFTLAYIAGVTSIDLTQGLIDFADAGNDVSFSVEPGDNIDISLSELGHSSIGVNAGQLDVATQTGTLIIESGESTHVDVDADTGEVLVTADKGTVDFETSTGMAVIEEGEMAGTNVDVDTGKVTISSEEGSVTFETETGTATIEEGASATTSKDCTDTCKISLGEEDGTVEFETSSGKVVIDDQETVGSRGDASRRK
nr:FecR domain-containing protein [Candidatus Brocadiales bacterium]